MSFPIGRRRLLAGAAGLAAGAALSARRPHPASAQAYAPVSGLDVRDTGETFRQGTAEGAAVVDGPDGPVVAAVRAGGVFTSRVLESPRPFTHVGLHHTLAGPPAARAACRFAVRTSLDGMAWSAWRALEPECRAGVADRDHTFCGLYFARRARFLQYRVAFGMAADARLSQVVTTVIDAPPVGQQTHLRTVTVADPATGRQLAVTPRELWLADPTYQRDEAGKEIWPAMFVPVKKLVVHHTATRNDYETVEEAAAEVRAIHYYHAVTQAWGDIGYTALVDRFGNLYEGRYGRGAGVTRETLSAGVVAGHTLAHNYGSAGVALLGDATLPDWPMPEPTGPMWDTLVRAGVFEAARSFLRPLVPGADRERGEAEIAASDFLRSDDAWHDAMRNVSGHRESFDTACPGDVVMAMLGDLRAAIHAGLADTSRTGARLTSKRRETTVGAAVMYDCEVESPEEGWRVAAVEYSVEGWFRPRGGDDIEYLSGYGPGSQPYQAWTRAEGLGMHFTLTVTPHAPGHFTTHVRVLVERGSGKALERRYAAYAGRHTLLVRAAEPDEPTKDQPPKD